MENTIKDVLEFINENDVKFIRLGFCDPFGIHKNISIMVDELADAFINGVELKGASIRGFDCSYGTTLLLFPDPDTLTVLPWRPGPGRVVRFYCYIKTSTGDNYYGDSRIILNNVIKEFKKDGLSCKIGTDCEFYLFKTDENGEPTYNSLDFGGYCDIAPLDKGENIRREICLTLEEMGLKPEVSHHEKGPGQNEIDFNYSEANTAADNFLTFKSVVKSISARNGLYASFMPKPLENEAGSGLRLNIAIDGFLEDAEIKAKQFIAGIIDKSSEMTLFLNPTVNSFSRLGNFSDSINSFIKVVNGDSKKVMIELRSPDCTINPYLAFALIISAGQYGIKNNLTMCEVSKDLPKNLSEAVESSKSSDFVLEVVGERLLNSIVSEKKAEHDAFTTAEDKNLYITEKCFYIH